MENSRQQVRFAPWWLAWLAAILPAMPATALELRDARSWQLGNGMTLIVLEEHALPVASVQMLYRVGARNEDNGRTGLAHFTEHMGYRATKNFPGTGVASSIYAVGGEWHGYTWIDQTTYFETVPREHVDLALRIEADRMASLAILPGDVSAERGAVLAELHGYENDPASVLHDAVVATAFLQHGYRNNTIGWESDVAAIGHGDLVDFYRTWYRPANAVLTVVGDVSADAVHARVNELFGTVTSGPPSPPVPTVEPSQRGERRLTFEGAGNRSFFEIGWVAPSARDRDYPAFLLLQEILAGGSGVNFRQNDGSTAVRADSLLAIAADGARDLATWLPAAEFPYLFTISGTARDGDSEAAVELAVDRAIAALREREINEATLGAAKERVLEELVFDVETTEDAAHELAFFAGLNALPQRLALPERVAEVTGEQLRAVAQRYLAPGQRTIGWYRASGAPVVMRPAQSVAPPPDPTAPTARRASVAKGGTPSAPLTRRLSGGLVAIVQRVPLSPAVHAGLVVPGIDWDVPPELASPAPAWGYTALGLRSIPRHLGPALQRLRAALGEMKPLAGPAEPAPSPEAALEAAMVEALGLTAPPSSAPARPLLVTVIGDVDVRATFSLLENTFARTAPAQREPASSSPPSAVGDVRIPFAGPAAQAQLGYVVVAPPPAERDALASQLALYVLSHGYEGRLGTVAINRRGLLYYIDSGYDSDGTRGWIRLAAGVDPPRLAALETVLRDELRELRERPPDAAEIAEARAHLLGREQTAVQSNEEVAVALARQWLWFGRIRQPGDLAKEMAAVSDDDVRRVVPELTGGASVTVEIPQ